MGKTEGPERAKEMVDVLKRWQSLERKAMSDTAEIIEETTNPLVVKDESGNDDADDDNWLAKAMKSMGPVVTCPACEGSKKDTKGRQCLICAGLGIIPTGKPTPRKEVTPEPERSFMLPE